MRIVAGQYKGRPIAAPKSRLTRPTSDRARESLFNMLAHASWAPPLKDARVMDLFAGSGALGLEALSRGAAYCLFVETDNNAAAAIQQNIRQLDASARSKLHRRDATKLGARAEVFADPFGLIFLDPPYNKGLIEPCLAQLSEGDWLEQNALVVAETAADEALGAPQWSVINERRSGAAKFWFLKQG